MTSSTIQITADQASKFEPTAKILAANGIAQSMSFITQRKYLNGISEKKDLFTLGIPDNYRIDSPSDPYWIKIEQIGKPLEKGPEKCFIAIQKILTSCFLPHKAQLLFLIHGEDGIFNIYLGVRSLDKCVVNGGFSTNLSNFIEGIWPGIKCTKDNSSIERIKNRICQYDFIDTLTGIPSMETQYQTIYPTTVDTLMSGMRKTDFTYIVIADPIEESAIDAVLYQCRDYAGQAESLKSFNFSENISSSIGKTLSEAVSVTTGSSTTEGTSSSRKSLWGTAAAGLMLASYIFPPAGAITMAISAAGGILHAANTIAGSNLVSEFTPVNTRFSTISKQTSNSKTETEGHSLTRQQGQAISENIVNKQITSAAEHLDFHAKRYESAKALGAWSVGVYVLGDTKSSLQSASMQLKSIVSGQETVFEPIRIHHIENLVSNIITQTLGSIDAPSIKVKNSEGSFFKHPFGNHFNDLRTVLTTKELSYYINLPLHTVPGISVVDSSPEFCLNEDRNIENAIPFGNLLYGGSETNMQFHIPLDSLSRHSLISGINGSGKTNTIQAILNGIGNIPFLVIEPAKTEYVDWAIEYNRRQPDRKIDIFIPGCKKYKNCLIPKDLKINPFEMVWLSPEQECNVLTHIDRIKSIFASAFPMYDVLPVLMEDLIYTVYQTPSTDWLNKEPVYGNIAFPTLNSMSMCVDKVIEHRQYEERVQRNMKACLNTRIDSLKRGWKGEMLNTLKSTDVESVFERPCVINLSYVGDDVDKSFIMALILEKLYEYRSALSELGRIDFNSNDCKHLTIVEEAHRVMAKCENMEMPQYKSAMLFSNMLSEIRAYGEGMMLVDQVPTRLIPDAIKNTNLKIVHRLVSKDDSEALGQAMSLSDEQRKIIPKLLTGQCLVSSSLSTEVYWVKSFKVK